MEEERKEGMKGVRKEGEKKKQGRKKGKKEGRKEGERERGPNPPPPLLFCNACQELP